MGTKTQINTSQNKMQMAMNALKQIQRSIAEAKISEKEFQDAVVKQRRSRIKNVK